MISYEKNMIREPRENVKGGVGPYVSTHIFTPEQVEKTTLFARNVFPVGTSIGIHPHGAEGEAYIVLRGQAVVTEDGVEYTLGPGDAEYCTGGHSHGIRNDGPEELEFLAIIMK